MLYTSLVSLSLMVAQTGPKHVGDYNSMYWPYSKTVFCWSHCVV